MPGFLKQSTAAQSRAIGPFINDTDFKTAETGLTIANTDIKLVVNGGASANKNSGGATHRINGVYGITFDATDTATVGEIEISVVVAGALPVFDKFFVLEEAVYDALIAASAPGYLQPTVAGRTLDVSATGEAGIDWANIGSPTTAQNLSATNIDVDQVVASVSGAVGSVTGNVGGNVTGSVGTVNALAANVITAAATAADFTTEIQAGLATQASVDVIDGIVDDILVDTAEIGVAGAGLTNINLPNQTMDIIGNITGNLSGSVGSVTGLTASDVGAIKAKTDSLTFTVAGQVDANAESMNATEILGNGTSGDLWRG
jgi:hypothetical protein